MLLRQYKDDKKKLSRVIHEYRQKSELGATFNGTEKMSFKKASPSEFCLILAHFKLILPADTQHFEA